MKSGEFNDLDYTTDALMKQLILVQNHVDDGSAVTAGCNCIETKHLFAISGYAEEGQSFAETPEQKEWFGRLQSWAEENRKSLLGTPASKERFAEIAEQAREYRKELEYGEWSHSETPEHQKCIERMTLECCGEGEKCHCDPVALCHAP